MFRGVDGVHALAYEQQSFGSAKRGRMRGTLLNSLLELGHATSQNLGFAHRDDVYVSYGEETITETNLLDLRRRHPKAIRLWTFGKKKEALNGADWEWHIIGRHRKFRMRVQAKRLQKNDKLKIPHKVASSGSQQIELLLNDAKAHGLKPVYCLYTSERQRNIWRKGSAPAGTEEFEYGCLLACAHKVKAKMPKTLPDIEAHCVPWHFLVDRQRYCEEKVFDFWDDDTTLSFVSRVAFPFRERAAQAGHFATQRAFPRQTWGRWSAPTVSNVEWAIGHIVGNGGHNPENSSGTYLRFWQGGGDDLALIQHAAQVVTRLGPSAAFRGGHHCARTGISTIRSQALTRLASPYIQASSKSFKPALLDAPHSFQAGFLRGFFDADGSVQGTTQKGRSIRLSQVDRMKLEWVQQMLLRLGIVSRIYFRKEAGEKLMPDGTGSLRSYPVRELWELVISNDNIEHFSSTIGFYKAQKANQLADLLSSIRRTPNRERFVATISEITPASVSTQSILLRSAANRSVRVEAGGFLLII